jgi:hypothetical protein
MPMIRGLPLGPHTYGGSLVAVNSTLKLAPIGFIDAPHLGHLTTVVAQFTKLATVDLAKDELLVNTSFTSSYDAATGELKVSGPFSTQGDLDAVLRAIAFRSSSAQLGSRPIAVSFSTCVQPVNNSLGMVPGVRCTVPKVVEVNILSPNRKPVLSSVQVSAKFVQGTPGGTQVDADIIVTDVDSEKLVSGVVKLHEPAATDELLVPAATDAPTGLTVVRSIGKKTLTIQGSASLAEYQQLLRAVVFVSSEISLAVPREVSFMVDDGINKSDKHLALIVPCAQAGFFVNASHAIIGCPNGKYQSATCSQSCDSCAAGKRGTAGAVLATSEAHCTFCTIGQYQPNAGASTCIKCEAGKYGGEKYGASRDHCEDCAAGTASPVVGAIGFDSCRTCIAGQYAGNASSVCKTCAQGRVATAAAKTCIECAAGRYSNVEVGLAECNNCTKGQYADGTGSTSCTDLTCCGAAGMQMEWATASINTRCRSLGNNPGCTHNGVCAACPVGQFQSRAVCTGEPCSPWKVCGAGQFLKGASTMSGGVCTSCPAGEFQSKSQHQETLCSQCGAGSFGTTIGATSGATCTPCAAGTFQELPGQSICIACQANQWFGLDASLSFGSNKTNGGIRADYCRPCEFTVWGEWGTCSKSCRRDSNHGTQARARQLVQSLRSNDVAVAQCAHLQSAVRSCLSTPLCPGSAKCEHLSCRFHIPVHGKSKIQVYHHGRAANVVHHCKMHEYENKKTCECSCWNDDITEQERRGELYKNDAAQQLSNVAEQARV